MSSEEKPADNAGNEPTVNDKLPNDELIDSTNHDNEALQNMRGEGRYFGTLEQTGEISGENDIICNRCFEKGHLKRTCPHIICNSCGKMDDHDSRHCPKTIRCTICNEAGHYRMQCPLRWKNIVCKTCKARTHTQDSCPSVWRSYILENTEGSTKDDTKFPIDKVYCYNCGLSGHFGDECQERRSSRVPNDNGSAFSNKNLSRDTKLKYLHELAQTQGSVTQSNDGAMPMPHNYNNDYYRSYEEKENYHDDDSGRDHGLVKGNTYYDSRQNHNNGYQTGISSFNSYTNNYDQNAIYSQYNGHQIAPTYYSNGYNTQQGQYYPQQYQHTNPQPDQYYAQAQVQSQYNYEVPTPLHSQNYLDSASSNNKKVQNLPKRRDTRHQHTMHNIKRKQDYIGQKSYRNPSHRTTSHNRNARNVESEKKQHIDIDY